MIVAGKSANGAQVNILARGNFSLNAGGLVSLLLALGVLTLGLSGLLALLGYWPILLVALAQLLLVSWVFIRVWKNTWIFEEISIDDRQVCIVHQRYRKRTKVCFESAWATIRLQRPEVSWHACKLILRCRGQQVELGAFLTDDEKANLAKHVSDALSRQSAWRN